MAVAILYGGNAVANIKTVLGKPFNCADVFLIINIPIADAFPIQHLCSLHTVMAHVKYSCPSD